MKVKKLSELSFEEKMKFVIKHEDIYDRLYDAVEEGLYIKAEDIFEKCGEGYCLYGQINDWINLDVNDLSETYLDRMLDYGLINDEIYDRLSEKLDLYKSTVGFYSGSSYFRDYYIKNEARALEFLDWYSQIVKDAESMISDFFYTLVNDVEDEQIVEQLEYDLENGVQEDVYVDEKYNIVSVIWMKDLMDKYGHIKP